MKDPFEKVEDQNRMRRLLDRVNELREMIDDMREWLGPQIDAPEKESECSCIKDNLFEMDTLLFAMYRTLHLYASGVITYLSNIESHESHRKVMELTPEQSGLFETLMGSPADVSEIVTPLPVESDDEGPGPNGVH